MSSALACEIRLFQLSAVLLKAEDDCVKRRASAMNILVHITKMHSVLKLFSFGAMKDKTANALKLLHIKLVDFLGLRIKCEEKFLSFPDACQIYTNF